MNNAEITVLRTTSVESKVYNFPVFLIIDTEQNIYSCYNNTHALCGTCEIFALVKPGDTLIITTVPVKDHEDKEIPKRYYVQSVAFKELASNL